MKKAKRLSISPSPFVFSGLRLEIANLIIIVSLLVQVILMIAFRDARALISILASLVGAAAAEACFASPVSSIKGKNVKFADGAAVISGLLSGFMLPSTINPVLAWAASFFGLFISRNFFNGRGNAWASAPAFAVIFAFISAPSCFEALEAFPPDISLHPAAAPSEFDYKITAALNNAILNPLGIALPEGYTLLFFNPAAPIPALKFNILTLLSFIVLVALDIIDWIAPAAFLFVYAATVCLFSNVFGEGLSYPLFYVGVGGNILFALFSNAVLFAAVYILSDFPCLPRTRTGRAALGALSGAAAFFACGAGGSSPAGAAFVVFAANLISLIIEAIEDRILYGYSLENVLHDGK